MKDGAKIRIESGMEEFEQSFAKMALAGVGQVSGVDPESFADVKKSCAMNGKQKKKSKVTK